ncbi:MAG TPA: signal peptidase II [Usitatibacter sp.]|jgi:signal peptidase II|nr:signal peptidase II [Usitatibacter sp.]
MREGSAPRWWQWLWLSAAVVALDLASKAWLAHILVPGEPHDLTPFLRIVLVYNSGAAFSFLAGAGGWQRWFFAAIAVLISIVLVIVLRRHRGPAIVAAALALVLGGALGNLWDRLTLGRVTDFVLLHAGDHSWPAFNVADSAITVGVAILIWESLWPKRGPAPGALPGEDA